MDRQVWTGFEVSLRKTCQWTLGWEIIRTSAEGLGLETVWLTESEPKDVYRDYKTREKVTAAVKLLHELWNPGREERRSERRHQGQKANQAAIDNLPPCRPVVWVRWIIGAFPADQVCIALVFGLGGKVSLFLYAHFVAFSSRVAWMSGERLWILRLLRDGIGRG